MTLLLVTVFLFSLIQLLDYPLVFLDLAKDGNEMIDSDDEDNHESNSDTKPALLVSPHRQLALEIMVTIGQSVYPHFFKRVKACAPFK